MSRLVYLSIILSIVVLVVLTSVLFYVNPLSSLLEPSRADNNAMRSVQKIMNSNSENTTAAVIAKFYAPLIPVTLGTEHVQASVADTNDERARGLSGTPYLPEEIVKLFIFEQSDTWGFWMKDMLYPIDILWLDASKTVVHIEHRVDSDSYPTSFVPTIPALYVIETKAGFAAQHNMGIGTQASW